MKFLPIILILLGIITLAQAGTFCSNQISLLSEGLNVQVNQQQNLWGKYQLTVNGNKVLDLQDNINQQKPVRGITLVVFEGQSATIRDQKTFDTHNANQIPSQDLVNYINQIAADDIVVAGVFDSANEYPNGNHSLTSQAISSLQSIGLPQNQAISFRDSFALIGGKNNSNPQFQYVAQQNGPAQVSSCVQTSECSTKHNNCTDCTFNSCTNCNAGFNIDQNNQCSDACTLRQSKDECKTHGCDWIKNTCQETGCTNYNWELPKSIFEKNAQKSVELSSQNTIITNFFDLATYEYGNISSSCFTAALQVTSASPDVDITNDPTTIIDFANQKVQWQIRAQDIDQQCKRQIDTNEPTYQCEYQFSLLFVNELQVNWKITQNIVYNTQTSAFTQVTILAVEKQQGAEDVAITVDSTLTLRSQDYLNELTEQEKQNIKLGDLIQLQHQIDNQFFRQKFKLEFQSAKFASQDSSINLNNQNTGVQISSQDNSSGWYQVKAKYPGDFTITVVSNLVEIQTGQRRRQLRQRFLATKNAQGEMQLNILDESQQKIENQENINNNDNNNSTTIIIISCVSVVVIVTLIIGLVYKFKLSKKNNLSKYKEKQTKQNTQDTLDSNIQK